ncbi:MAG: erythronate-4-phosphate dehydrogenase [Paraglaciecola sp.]|jgi:erythronate-4-phosphate dehydrogenase
MKIYYEDSLPYAHEFFAGFGECKVFSHRTVNARQIADADILLVRSTTKVNEALLHLNQQVQYVATATAGTNHMDFEYLNSRGIAHGSAGGCNAVAVAEYVLSALFVMAEKLQWQLSEKVVGIVGAGHVGSALQGKLEALGIPYKLCDPPLAATNDARRFVDLDEIMDCDVLTLHVPYIKDGEYKTQHMFDAKRLAQLTQKQVLINACRGEVVDNQAALALFQQGKKLNLVLDVWENEPGINQALVPYVKLATAHIAGHTIEGKARGTEMLYQQLCKRLGLPVVKQLSDYLPSPEPALLTLPLVSSKENIIRELVLRVYDIAQDDLQFKASLGEAEQFRYIRKHYPIRREFAALKVNAGNYVESKAIYALGFLPP